MEKCVETSKYQYFFTIKEFLWLVVCRSMTLRPNSPTWKSFRLKSIFEWRYVTWAFQVEEDVSKSRKENRNPNGETQKNLFLSNWNKICAIRCQNNKYRTESLGQKFFLLCKILTNFGTSHTYVVERSNSRAYSYHV